MSFPGYSPDFNPNDFQLLKIIQNNLAFAPAPLQGPAVRIP